MLRGLSDFVRFLNAFRRSLKTKIIVVTLTIFVAGIWSLSLYATRNLRNDMVRMLGEQQFSTVNLIANQVDYELTDRIRSLQEVAHQSTDAIMAGPAAMQAQLDRWRDIYTKFNGGTFAVGRDGVAIAAVPVSLKRSGVNYLDRDYVQTVLNEGRPAISGPMIGRVLKVPVVIIAVPLRDKAGVVVGVLSGVINMQTENFLDRITENLYGKTGGYLLVVPQRRMVATATDKSRVMEILPPEGKIALIDRFINGFEGYGITVNHHGQEMLASARGVPVAGWYVAALLPTDEAFAPIREVQRHVILAALVLTLLAGSVIWLFLRKQIAPLLLATDTLSALSDHPEQGLSLPVVRDDEVGQLVGGFNNLLESLCQRESLLTQILDTSSVAIFLVDSEGKITLANRRMYEMFRWPEGALPGCHYVDLIHPSEREMGKQRMIALLNSEISSVDLDRLYFRKDHSQFWGHLNGGRLIDPKGSSLGLVGVIADIDARKQGEEKLRLAASVFSHAREGIVITGADGAIIDVNEAFTRITGYSREEALGQNPRILKSDHHSAEFYNAMWREIVDKGYWSGEIWNRRKNGELYPEILTISAVFEEGKTLHYVALFTDISPMKAQEEQLRQMAHFDLLTTLPNRALLADRLKQAVSQSHRRRQRLAVVCLDLDGFKAVNDTYGHKVGDDLLVALSSRMRQSLRDGDTLARLGGDEFIAVLVDLNDTADCLPLLNRLLAAASQPVMLGEFVLQVSASLGVTFYPQAEETDADQLMRQADQAMYHAKLSGKNRYQIFDTEQHRSARGIHENIEDIRRALEAGEFVLYYQPKVNMRDGSVVGVEALIRWSHPEKGLLSPVDFLPMIENHPLAIQVGEWVIRTALGQVRSWRKGGIALAVSVNVGAHQLQQRDFAASLQAILADFPDIPPGELDVEILETSALDDINGVCNIIAACQELGVTFSLDDFGTGYSSLNYLKRLSVNQLKIDQTFVRDMLDDPDDLTILEGMISLAGAFRRQVIAEGVESVAHGRLLLQLGCELAQGYGIARPMPAADIPTWLASWQPDPGWSGVRPLRREYLPALFALVEHRACVAALAQYVHDGIAPPKHEGGKCRFADWLHATGVQHPQQRDAFTSLERRDREMHSLATTLIGLNAEGKTVEAKAVLNELMALRDEMQAQLIELIRQLD